MFCQCEDSGARLIDVYSPKCAAWMMLGLWSNLRSLAEVGQSSPSVAFARGPTGPRLVSPVGLERTHHGVTSGPMGVTILRVEISHR